MDSPTTDRRFSEREIARILEQAGTAQELVEEMGGAESATSTPAALGPGQGLTLAQLQEIGRDVGIAPEHIARAAGSVARGDAVPTRAQHWLGLPIGVSRTIDFGRPVDEAEWDRLVVLLRETFQARGRMERHGNFREWRNGNLQALLEPTEHGHRLRLLTRKGNVGGRIMLGGVLMAAGAAMGASFTPADAPTALSYVMPGVLAGIGALNIALTAFGLPKWARRRAEQMETIAGLGERARLNTAGRE